VPQFFCRTADRDGVAFLEEGLSGGAAPFSPFVGLYLRKSGVGDSQKSLARDKSAFGKKKSGNG